VRAGRDCGVALDARARAFPDADPQSADFQTAYLHPTDSSPRIFGSWTFNPSPTDKKRGSADDTRIWGCVRKGEEGPREDEEEPREAGEVLRRSRRC
jgi:hypothetical protein